MARWSVIVKKDGDEIVCIETSFISGKSNLTDDDLDVIRIAANHLLSFAGPTPEQVEAIDQARELDGIPF